MVRKTKVRKPLPNWLLWSSLLSCWVLGLFSGLSLSSDLEAAAQTKTSLQSLSLSHIPKYLTLQKTEAHEQTLPTELSLSSSPIPTSPLPKNKEPLSNTTPNGTGGQDTPQSSSPSVNVPIAQSDPISPEATPLPVAEETSDTPPTPEPTKTPSYGTVWPVVGTITTYFSSWHLGIDIANTCGLPIYAANSGTVSFAGWDTTGYGNRVDVGGDRYSSLYGHLSIISTWYGQWLSQGDLVGYLGSTGNSTGCHLHFELSDYGSKVNPLGYLP